jgi:hypothetical protein
MICRVSLSRVDVTRLRTSARSQHHVDVSAARSAAAPVVTQLLALLICDRILSGRPRGTSAPEWTAGIGTIDQPARTRSKAQPLGRDWSGGPTVIRNALVITDEVGGNLRLGVECRSHAKLGTALAGARICGRLSIG